MLRLTVAAALAGVCAQLLTACSQGASVADPVTSPPTSSAAVSTPPRTPQTSPPTSISLPQLPPLARKESVAGAKAFVGVIVEEMNTAWSTMQTRALRSLFGPRCTSCTSIAAGIDGIRRDSGKTEGSVWSVRALSPIPLQPLARPIIHAAIRTSPGRWKPTATTSWRRIPSSTAQWDFHLSWNGREWALIRAVSQ